ncbi:hypothetical protein N752_15385 [Desulforamulus aquiferis]|nr:thiamine diphosphokinase [Desulforamulus aquiferis]RYD04225.1 hypothetical protein N752_15385 [Desulforamulus aquiferis]
MDCIILANGEIKDYQQYKYLFTGKEIIICADGGVNHTPELGIIPQLVIGDMDSANPKILEQLELKGAQIMRYPRDKDQMDTELAIAQGISQGATSLTFLGCTGDRLDHTLAAIHLLVPLALKGLEVKIISDSHFITVITPKAPATYKGIQEI